MKQLSLIHSKANQILSSNQESNEKRSKMSWMSFGMIASGFGIKNHFLFYYYVLLKFCTSTWANPAIEPS